MTKICAQCEREITDVESAHELELTVEDSVEMKVEDGFLYFCSPRCKRDWLDHLFAKLNEWPPNI